MLTLADAIKANAAIKGSLRSLNIIDNCYHSCFGKPSSYWSPECYASHLANCESCPATWLNEVVREVAKHPTMTSLFGLDPQVRSLKLEVGSSASSPLMWALFREISRHQKLERLDLSAVHCAQDEMRSLSAWLSCNSLLRVIRVSQYSPYEEQSVFCQSREVSFESRVAAAVFMRGCSRLGGGALRHITEFLYGEGPQAHRFLKYKHKSSFPPRADRMSGGAGQLKLMC
jgi:hypothetical protein